MSTTAGEERLLGRATEIGRVVAKYGLRERGAADVPIRERARNLRQALEELGPTFAKLGQILSTRPDLLPPEFIDELATLQDKVTPMSESDVVSVMEEELGVPWEDVFEAIEPEPLAAGTIGQVHVATLESGQKVVVKVQRRGARVAIMRDLGLLELFAGKAESRPGLRKLVDIPAVIRHLSESGALELRDGRWVLTAAIEDLGIPEGVRDVVGRRLSRLPEEANRVLSVASVVGILLVAWATAKVAGRWSFEAAIRPPL